MNKRMAKFILIMIIGVMGLSLTACAEKTGSGSDKAQTSTEPQKLIVDEDLTALSSTMVYSTVLNMMTNGKEYDGKLIRMSGLYSEFYDESTNTVRQGCIIQDATACCAQGIEYVLAEEPADSTEIPKDGEEITVVGTFKVIEDEKYTYCIVEDAVYE